MQTIPLGKTGLRVSRLGFGAAPLGDLYALLNDAAAIDAVVEAVRGGINLIDTSPLYGHGLSEHRVGTALRRLAAERPGLLLSSKVGRVMQPARGPDWDREGYLGGLPFEAKLDYSYDATLRSIEQSLLRLGTDQLDIVLIHDVDARNHGAALDARFSEAVNGAYRALDALRSQGVIRALGIGVNEAPVCVRFAKECQLDVVLLAGRYSLLDDSATQEFFPLAQQQGIGILLGGVFNSGILATGAIQGAKYDYADASEAVLQRVRRMEAVCNRHQVPLACAAMQFAAAHPAVHSLVLGAVSPAEVQRNFKAWQTPIPAALWQELRSERLIAEHLPTPL